MTNINCTCDCIYQKEGKCSLDEISIKTLSGFFDCAYWGSKNYPKKNT